MPDENPYLALLQQEEKPPSTAQLLQMFANLVGGASAGIGQTGTWGGVGPGLMMGINANAQEADNAEKRRLRKAEIGIQASKWDYERKQREAQAAAMSRMGQSLMGGGSGGPVPGVTAPQGPQVAMGPGGDYDTRLRGYEGGIRQGGMIFNELGSGAFGPYQFMPGTWADVRANNPSLNLPADMTQATREQHDAAHGAFKGANAAMLQAAGLQPTPENLYLAHRFGAAGAVNMLRADPNKLLAEVLPVQWQRQNPDMRGQTVGGFQRLATERMGGVGVPYQVPPDAKPTQYAMIPPQGGGEGDAKPGGDLSGWTMPVMPQPQWPAQAQQPPQVAPGGTTPINPNAPMPPFMQPQPQPQPPAPVVQAQSRPPAPGGPVPHGPPIVPPPRPQDLPPPLKQQLYELTQTPGVTPEEYLKAQQQILGHWHQQLQTQAIEGWREQKAAQLHAQGRSEKQIDAEIAKIEAEKLREYQKEEEGRKNERERKEEAERHARDAAEREAAAERARAEARAAEERRIAESRATATGSAHNDLRILAEGTASGKTDTLEYATAFDRIENSLTDAGDGQKVSPNMKRYRVPTYQAPGTPPATPQATPQAPQMGGGPRVVGDKKYTESQGKDYTYARRLQNSIPQLEAMLRNEVTDPKTGEKVVSYSTKKLPDTLGRMMAGKVAGVGAPDILVSDRAKEFRRLSKDIVSAVLRRESGASIPSDEYQPEYEKYIPLPGDSEREIKAKLQALKVAASSIAEGSGRQLHEFGGVFDLPPTISVDQQGNVIK